MDKKDMDRLKNIRNGQKVRNKNHSKLSYQIHAMTSMLQCLQPLFLTFEIFTSVNNAKNKIGTNLTPRDTHTFNSYRGTYVHGRVVYN